MSKNVRFTLLCGVYIFVFSSIIHVTESCEDRNARPGCGGNCGRRCSDYDKGPVACTRSCRSNGCNCNNGYYYDENIRKCVRPEECSQICGQNEEYTTCVQGGCVGARNCSQISGGQIVPVICKKIDPSSCTAGCICQDNFLKNYNGICVSEEECSLNDQCSDKQNEFWDTCPPMCFSESCANIGKQINCPPQTAVCRPRCRCAKGYYRNSDGICVPKKQCNTRNQCGRNEIFDKCLTSCPPRTCGINDAAVLCAPTYPADCKSGCRCADGFYRNNRGKCVAWENCPQCPRNEVYDPCPNPCPPQLCSVDERIIRCAAPPNLGDPACKPGCRCEDGYKRNNRGICIPKDQCPKFS